MTMIIYTYIGFKVIIYNYYSHTNSCLGFLIIDFLVVKDKIPSCVYFFHHSNP
jgi:hypothetical protein